MENQIKIDALEPKYIQILRVLFNVRGASKVKTKNKKSKVIKLVKNELDYFEYTYY